MTVRQWALAYIEKTVTEKNTREKWWGDYNMGTQNV